MDGPGLWGVQLRYRDTPVKFFPLRLEPFYEGQGVVAVSPLLENSKPVVLTAARRELGSVTIQLQDAAGKPVRGFVLIDQFMDEAEFAGSTDAQGKITFSGVQPWKHTLEALLPRQTLPELGDEGDPLPRDAELWGREAFFEEHFTC